MHNSAQSFPASNSFVDTSLSNVTRIVTTASQQSLRPDVFAHVQPHSNASAKLARHFAAALLSQRCCNSPLKEIEAAALMHDLGKYYIASAVLLKTGALDGEERALVSLHPIYGEAIVSKFPWTTELIRRIVLHHHERWDGDGYPDGLAKTAIPWAARIVSIVDVYTSLRSRRSYKVSFSKSHSLAQLTLMAGNELDPYLIEDFLHFMEQDQDHDHVSLNAEVEVCEQ